MRLVLALFATMLSSLPLKAEEVDCTNPLYQRDLNFCASAEFAEADAKLNELYRALRDSLANDEKRLVLLRSAQRAWIDFRDSECTFKASEVEGGTAQPMVESQCLTEQTNRRSADFQRQLDCSEGNIICPLSQR